MKPPFPHFPRSKLGNTTTLLDATVAHVHVLCGIPPGCHKRLGGGQNTGTEPLDPKFRTVFT